MRPTTVPGRCIVAGEGQFQAETRREAGAALGNSVGIQYTAVAVMLGIGVLTLWVLLAGYSIKDLSSRATLSIAGYFRGRPDPWLEGTLRVAFAEFDRELALILQDRGHAAAKREPRSPQDPAPPGR